MNDDLTNLGEMLESAVANDIAANRNTSRSARHVSPDHSNVIEEDPMLTSTQPSRTRKRSRRIAVIGAVAVLGIGGAAAAAVSTMSSDEVSRGLPGGSMIFQGTNPSCTSTDGVVFQCTLASAPTQEVEDDYTNSAQLFVDADPNIAGGCRGQSADGSALDLLSGATRCRRGDPRCRSARPTRAGPGQGLNAPRPVTLTVLLRRSWCRAWHSVDESDRIMASETPGEN